MKITPVLLLLWLIAGCSSDRTPVYPIKGVVFFEDAPMSGGGSIAFIPLTQQAGKAAGGEIDSQGEFVISTYGDSDGSPSGKFRVLIHQSVWGEPDNTGDGEHKKNGGLPKPVLRVQEKQKIPVIYSNVQESPLIIDVGPDSSPVLTINLVKNPKS